MATTETVFIPTIDAERGRRYDDVDALLNRHPFHLCIEHSEVGPLALALLRRWIDDDDAWSTAEEAEIALRHAPHLEFAPINVYTVIAVLQRRMMP